jgi:hypothetical protein
VTRLLIASAEGVSVGGGVAGDPSEGLLGSGSAAAVAVEVEGPAVVVRPASPEGPGISGQSAGMSNGGANALGGLAAVGTATAAGGGVDAQGGISGGPVTDQVFGQVTRLVSRGDGTHRLMLRLHPADLGEVKVVLTVKGGAVDVTLSAGPAARDALREGSPQLRALLELAGATTGQVTVRDLATGTVASSANAVQQQLAGSGWADQSDQQGSGGRDAALSDGAAGDGADDGRRAGGDGQPGARGRAAAVILPTTRGSHDRVTSSQLDLNI